MKRFAIILAVSAIVAIASQASAAVIEEASVQFTETSTASSHSFTIDLKAASNSVALIGVARAFTANITTFELVSDDGTFSATQLLADAGPKSTDEIWAIDLGTVNSDNTATFNVMWDDGKEAAYFAAQLSNATLADPVLGQDEGTSGARSVTLEGLTAGMYALAVGSDTKDATAEALTGIADAGFGSDGPMTFAFGGEVVAAGDLVVGYDPDDGNNKGNGLGVVAIAPVPEPATMSLLAMGGLAVLRRRRR